MRSRIALRLLAFFACALLLFALVSGFLFRSLFTQAVIRAKKTDMLDRAGSLSSALSETLNSAAQGGQGFRGMGGPGGGFGSYARSLTQTEPDTWVLDENLDFLSSGRMTMMSLSYDSLPPDAERLVREVFQGLSPFSEGFGTLLGYPTLTVGVPILQDDKVVGALLMHDAVSGIDEAVAQGQRNLLYSGIAALLIAIALSTLLSYSFTKPINRMRQTAQRLAEGDYLAKTGMAQHDEIGELALSIDALSDKLLAAREAGEKQEQQRKEFLANVSHELRTPVTVLRGSLEALRDGVVAKPEQVNEYYGQMLKETEGLQRLVNDLMELARLQNADFPIESAPLALSDVLDDALRSAQRLAQAKFIVIERDTGELPASFSGDYARLRQMLLIVLDNAVKFSPKNGTIHVSADMTGISVKDEGPGIPQEDLPYIFDRFHKSRSEENRQGSGLGLAIAGQIAARHGIHIDIMSGQGTGTSVSFKWPGQK